MDSLDFCPVCGFVLNFQPWYTPKNASFGVCGSCGIEFGFDDDELACGKPGTREERWIALREQWILEGMPWKGPKSLKPTGWDPEEQLKNLRELVKMRNR